MLRFSRVLGYLDAGPGMGFLDPNSLLGTLRGLTVQWIGEQFCACIFVDSRDKSLIMVNLSRNDKRN